jgi:hypothetical protein
MFTWSFAVTLAAIGGFAAAVGVLLGWWQAEAYRASEIFGREQVEQRTLLGTVHWSGTAALVLGFLVALAALSSLALADDRVRSAAAFAALSGGILVMAAASYGLAQATHVAEAQVGGPGLGVDGTVGGGLFLSAGGGLVAAVAGFLARRTAEP